MITETYIYTHRNGEEIEYLMEYTELDSFENLDATKISQSAALAYDPHLKKVFLQAGKNKLWGHPGGTIEEGEHYEETLIREIEEETHTRVIKYWPLGAMKVSQVKNPENWSYQIRYVAMVKKIGDFEYDPANPDTVCNEIDIDQVNEFVKWGNIGERIYEQSVVILKNNGFL